MSTRALKCTKYVTTRFDTDKLVQSSVKSSNYYLKGKPKRRLGDNVKILLVRICNGTTFCSRLFAELEMAAGHELPELVLSRNSAKYLLTRNAGERELLKRTFFLIDKAKSEEQRGFEREREQLSQRQSGMLEIQKPPRCVKFNTAKNVISRRNEAVTDKWNL